jgi:hypothetical protein
MANDGRKERGKEKKGAIVGRGESNEASNMCQMRLFYTPYKFSPNSWDQPQLMAQTFLPMLILLS